MTSRFVLVVLMLVVAPTAALVHLLLSWLPGTVAIARLDYQTQAAARDFERVSTELESVEKGIRKLRAAAAQGDRHARAGWLPKQDRQGVLKAVARALDDERVSVEQFTPADPALYAGVSRSVLLACDAITVVCAGEYDALTACLDRLADLEYPKRFAEVGWTRSGQTLRLTVRLEFPFVPDDALRDALADIGGLEDEG